MSDRTELAKSLIDPTPEAALHVNLRLDAEPLALRCQSG